MNIFCQWLQLKIAETKITKRELSKALNADYQLIWYFVSGTRLPNHTYVRHFSKIFKCPLKEVKEVWIEAKMDEYREKLYKKVF